MPSKEDSVGGTAGRGLWFVGHVASLCVSATDSLSSTYPEDRPLVAEWASRPCVGHAGVMGAVPFFDEAFSGGHLLVVQGDLTALAVDAVVIPCDSQGNAHEGFLPLLGSVEPSTYLPGFARVPAFADRGDGLEGPVRLAGVDGRQVWLIDTTARTHGTAATLVAAVGNAIEQVGAALGPGMTVALPLPGVGDGGFGSTYFSVISALIPELEERAAHLDLDMVLTVRARSDYAAVQHFRRDSARHAQTPTAAAADVTGGATRVLEGLARFAREGRLVPFLGAGASVGAGAPSWWGLLEDLARTAGIAEEHIPSLQQLDARDAATVIARIGRRDSPDSDADDSDQLHSIRTAIVERLAGDTYTVTQGLIAGLAVPEAITTNYDRQYEIANTHTSSTDPSRTFDVLPHVRPRLGSPWLMKIHGDGGYRLKLSDPSTRIRYATPVETAEGVRSDVRCHIQQHCGVAAVLP